MTLFIPCYNPFVTRNILASDVLLTLKQQANLRVVVFVASYKKEFMERTYGAPNVIFEGFDPEKTFGTKEQKRWYRLAFLFLNTQYVRDQRREHLYKGGSYLNYLKVNAIAFLLSHLPFLRGLYRRMDFKKNLTDVFAPYFEQYKPDLIFSPDIFAEADVLLMREAKHRGIPIVGMVRSWDNTTTKGILRIFPNKILVNSSLLKEDLIKFHSYPAQRIEVVGLPQFDRWVDGPTLTREEFFRSIGADPAKRLIMFSPLGSALSDTDWQLCDILKQLPDDVQVLVRNHPHHPADFSRLAGDPRFIIETPGTQLKPEDYKYAEYQPQEHAHLMHSVYYCDIIMYIATSLGLDAQVYNKPQIIIAFDGYEQKPYVVSVRRYDNEDCIKSIIATKGVRVANTPHELLGAIKAYLANPALDQEGRDRILNHHLYKIDGNAGKRIADAIINYTTP